MELEDFFFNTIQGKDMTVCFHASIEGEEYVDKEHVGDATKAVTEEPCDRFNNFRLLKMLVVISLLLILRELS